VAWPIKNISEPNSHVKNPLMPRKTTRSIYAISESKNDCSSLLEIIQTDFICLCLSASDVACGGISLFGHMELVSYLI
jgi:hypothetical protein